jgi:hypothetical protein
MPANIQVDNRVWEARVAWRWRRFWMDAPKFWAWRHAGGLDATGTTTAETERPSAANEDEEIEVWVRECYVAFLHRGVERMGFRVNPLKDGRFTFSDPRERETGVAGTTGIWGTLPPMRPARPRSLTPTAFKVEAARFVGKERADQIVLEIRNSDFFRAKSDNCNTSGL